ncbi:hypothetical protein B0H17DRAFT_1100753, partial [Mycena rosella]
EVITHARFAADASWEYRVRWVGFSRSEDTWKPAAGLAACQALLTRFWTEVGHDEKDYPVGSVVQPSEEWIRKEQNRFQAL